ncbi:MAG TPA: plastocyanin/azurin family copper-binding protein [Vicinamibacterales bacterium]|jgi:azurin
MKMFSLVCVLALAAAPLAAAQDMKAPAKKAAAATKAGSATGGRTVEITGSETMKYSVTEITAKPGEKLHIVLKALGSMPKIAMAHNFVLLKAGVSGQDVATAAFNARATDFIPPDMKDKILVHTGLVGGGETGEISFTAPAKPGTYTFLCTFPGHFSQGMTGTLTVK